MTACQPAEQGSSSRAARAEPVKSFNRALASSTCAACLSLHVSVPAPRRLSACQEKRSDKAMPRAVVRASADSTTAVDPSTATVDAARRAALTRFSAALMRSIASSRCTGPAPLSAVQAPRKPSSAATASVISALYAAWRTSRRHRWCSK
ncbi:hypothetical protein SAVERM_1403 [Streptomyces avermitilis MA-4680 = NBRC 14893]|uniref:Uncharacterized protein n=1 Tax=Streptomyces avermitilis (strain ATCC 31267 / DSM 46492 / JCM 5070 / NBRC 14893 / NCIMB 12804 / NRRL 8165 / MA-4680) TaxID=227882 RepID=Q82NA0_STRAW|nr:hypothetical protein SAVERM_1403 [Streptomyces avermitilis MA-4680 = NBRC 14893]